MDRVVVPELGSVGGGPPWQDEYVLSEKLMPRLNPDVK